MRLTFLPAGEVTLVFGVNPSGCNIVLAQLTAVSLFVPIYKAPLNRRRGIFGSIRFARVL